MGTFSQIIGLLLAGFLIWWLYTTIKNKPQVFSKANFVKSAGSMGVLGLLLIAFVAFLILMLKN